MCHALLLRVRASYASQVLSFATIIIGTINYAVPSGHVHPGFIYALFWYVALLLDHAHTSNLPYRVYVTFALVTCIPMLMIWYNQPHDLTHFTPAYAFLVRLGLASTVVPIV